MSNNILPFWFDNLELLYYIPENTHVTIEELYQKYGISPTLIMQCKAWWNTNIPMDNFLPIIIPVDTNDAGFDICLQNFVQRIKQRSEGKMCPEPPELKLTPGIMLLNKTNLEFTGIYLNHPNDSDIIRLLEIQDNRLNGSWVNGEVIKRDLNFLYWDMIEKKYV